MYPYQEGLGVRAKKRANPAHSELKRCTLIRNLKEGVINYCFFCEVWLGDWYYSSTNACSSDSNSGKLVCMQATS